MKSARPTAVTISCSPSNAPTVYMPRSDGSSRISYPVRRSALFFVIPSSSLADHQAVPAELQIGSGNLYSVFQFPRDSFFVRFVLCLLNPRLEFLTVVQPYAVEQCLPHIGRHRQRHVLVGG